MANFIENFKLDHTKEQKIRRKRTYRKKLINENEEIIEGSYRIIQPAIDQEVFKKSDQNLIEYPKPLNSFNLFNLMQTFNKIDVVPNQKPPLKTLRPINYESFKANYRTSSNASLKSKTEFCETSTITVVKETLNDIVNKVEYEANKQLLDHTISMNNLKYNKLEKNEVSHK